jgi:RNA polymerase subunit RPABC4/transcription elongation factor Spt4
MKIMSVCKNCSTYLQAEQRFCRECGALLETREENGFKIECETHPDRRAIGLCIICGRPVCSDCEVTSGGKILCTDPEHRTLVQDWRVIHQPDSEFEAEALVRNLADNGIEAKTFSLHDSVATYWLNENRVLLYVRKSEGEKAKALLKELNLINNN